MNVPVLVVLVAASVCGIGLREAKSKMFSAWFVHT